MLRLLHCRCLLLLTHTILQALGYKQALAPCSHSTNITGYALLIHGYTQF